MDPRIDKKSIKKRLKNKRVFESLLHRFLVLWASKKASKIIEIWQKSSAGAEASHFYRCAASYAPASQIKGSGFKKIDENRKKTDRKTIEKQGLKKEGHPRPIIIDFGRFWFILGVQKSPSLIFLRAQNWSKFWVAKKTANRSHNHHWLFRFGPQGSLGRGGGM
jgi:hypothetical protein